MGGGGDFDPPRPATIVNTQHGHCNQTVQYDITTSVGAHGHVASMDE